MENKCKYSELCGGCQLQGLSYKEQLAYKQEKIDKLLFNIKKPEKIIGMDNPLNYRNKVQVSFTKDHKGKVLAGNYIPSTHLVVPIEDCILIDEKANEIINSICRLINKYKISIFDERVYKGCLRHVLIRCSNTGEYMVVLVTGSFNINKKEQFLNDLIKYNPCITTIIQNHNNEHTSMILGNKNIVLYGKGYIEDELCGYRFKISANSFYQVNKNQTEVLYKKAIEYGDFNGTETIIDAYCGTGTIGIITSKNVKKVIGVELNSQAIKDAVVNAKNNKVKNINFICDDAGNFMNMLSRNHEQIDAVIMDPPRAGADTKFLNSLVRLKPKKIVYVSCGPESLKSNLNYLIKNGYVVKKIQPVDMFPFTSHVENIAMLIKR